MSVVENNKPGKTHNKYYSDVLVDKHGNPVQFPGVTTVLSRFKNSEPLLHWANKVGREQGITVFEARKPAASAGSIVHDMVERHIKKEPEINFDLLLPTLGKDGPQIVVDAKHAYRRYLDWEMNTRIEVSAAHMELELKSEKYRFGGRLDAIGQDGGYRLCILDWKSGSAFFDEMKFQTAAYTILWEEHYPAYPLVGGAHVCFFKKKNGEFSHHAFDREEIERCKPIFLSWLAVYPSLKEELG